MNKLNTKSNVHFSSNTDEWETPPELFAKLNATYNFTLDPCCTHKTAKCIKHFTVKEDGLSQPWTGHRVFCNPPYSRGTQAKWIKKAYEESLRGATVVLLVPARPDTKVWHDYCMKGNIEFIKGRVKFLQNNRVLSSAPFPSAIVVFNPPGYNSEKIALLTQIQNYLSAGGAFNPELMKHNAVRNLIISLGVYLERI